MSEMVRVVVDTEYSYLAEKGTSYLKSAAIIFCIGVVFLFVPTFGFLIAGALFLVAMTLMGKWSAYAKGISGEKRVSKALKKLDDDYFLLEDIKLYPRSGNIDHIVLGPNGIFVIETKNYSGVVSCYGDTWYRASQKGAKGFKIRSISEQAKNAARTLHGFLRSNLVGGFISQIFVEPIIVFTNSSMQLKTKNPTVRITSPKKIVRDIQRHDGGVYLTEWNLKRIADVIAEKSVSEVLSH